jgi:hypothetical protein
MAGSPLADGCASERLVVAGGLRHNTQIPRLCDAAHICERRRRAG